MYVNLGSIVVICIRTVSLFSQGSRDGKSLRWFIVASVIRRMLPPDWREREHAYCGERATERETETETDRQRETERESKQESESKSERARKRERERAKVTEHKYYLLYIVHFLSNLINTK